MTPASVSGSKIGFAIANQIRYLLVVEAHDDAKNGEDQRPQ
jgi:hypothetical protein